MLPGLLNMALGRGRGHELGHSGICEQGVQLSALIQSGQVNFSSCLQHFRFGHREGRYWYFLKVSMIWYFPKVYHD